jgi:hypothetical protein
VVSCPVAILDSYWPASQRPTYAVRTKEKALLPWNATAHKLSWISVEKGCRVTTWKWRRGRWVFNTLPRGVPSANTQNWVHHPQGIAEITNSIPHCCMLPLIWIRYNVSELIRLAASGPVQTLPLSIIRVPYPCSRIGVRSVDSKTFSSALHAGSTA